MAKLDRYEVWIEGNRLYCFSKKRGGKVFIGYDDELVNHPLCETVREAADEGLNISFQVGNGAAEFVAWQG